MDEKLERAVDLVIQDELVRNVRIVEHDILGRIKIQRPTPRMERVIADERRKQYQRDLLTKDVLSRAEIEALATNRGMWSPEQAERLQDLLRRTGGLMGVLEAVGFKSLDELIEDYYATQAQLHVLYPDVVDREIIGRYYNLENEPRFDDRKHIFDGAGSSTVDDILDEADRLREQIDLFKEMIEVRKELTTLQQRQATLFVDSIEGRSERAEELARIYYCCSSADKPIPLWPSFDAMWDADPTDIEFLVAEVYYFMNGITEEFRELLGRHGFIQRVVDIGESLEDSPGHPESLPVGEPAANEPPTSLELETVSI